MEAPAVLLPADERPALRLVAPVADDIELTVTRWPSATAPGAGASARVSWTDLLAWLRQPVVAAEKLSLGGFALASFRDNYRAAKNVESVYALTLDDDTGERDVEATAALWAEYAGVTVSTFSSTPEAPRTRTILRTTRPMTREEYAVVWRYVAARALERGIALDPSPKDASRLWFVPAVRPDGVYGYAELEGEPLDVDAILAAAPGEHAPPSVAAALRVVEGGTAPALRADHRGTAAALIAANWPPPGARSEARLAMSGACRHAGLSQADAAAFVKAVHGMLDDRGDVTDGEIDSMVARTYARSEGEPVYGWPTLARHIDPAIVDAARGLLGSDASGAADFAFRMEERHAADFAFRMQERHAADSPAVPPASTLQVATSAAAVPQRPDRRFGTVAAAELAKPLPPRQYVFREWGIARGRPTLLAGYGGIGKTFLVQLMALVIAAGRGELWGLPVGSGPVVHIDYEMTLEPIQDRYQRLAYGAGVDLASAALEVSSMPPVYLSDDDAEDKLVELCTGKTLAIIDNLAAATATASLKENESGIRRFLDVLTRVTARTGCVFIVLVHERKPSQGESSGGGLHRVRGSSAITDAAGSVISVSAAEGDGIVSVQQTKSSLRKAGRELLLRIEDIGVPDGSDEDPPGLRVVRVEERPPSEKSQRIQTAILELLGTKGPQETKRKIEDAIGGKRGTVGPEVDALVVRRQVAFIKGVGFCLDTDRARRARVFDVVNRLELYTAAKVAAAAHVDTDFVKRLLLERSLSQDGTHRFWANVAPGGGGMAGVAGADSVGVGRG